MLSLAGIRPLDPSTLLQRPRIAVEAGAGWQIVLLT
jgi:hypothetical protein